MSTQGISLRFCVIGHIDPGSPHGKMHHRYGPPLLASDILRKFGSCSSRLCFCLLPCVESAESASGLEADGLLLLIIAHNYLLTGFLLRWPRVEEYSLPYSCD